MGKDERGIVLSSGQKDRTLQNGRAEIYGLAVFHELLEQPQDLLVHWWASSCCKAAKILCSGCRRTLRFIILVGNVSSVIDNFILSVLSFSISFCDTMRSAMPVDKPCFAHSTIYCSEADVSAFLGKSCLHPSDTVILVVRML